MTRAAELPDRSPSRGPKSHKRFLYVCPDPELTERFLSCLSEVEGCTRLRENAGTSFLYKDLRLRFVVRTDPGEAHETLHRDYFNLVLIDLRSGHGPKGHLREKFEKAVHLLDAMDAEPDVEMRYGFHRIMVLISGHDSLEVDDLIKKLGARGVGQVIRDTTLCTLDPTCRKLPPRAAFGRIVLDEALRMVLGRKRGSRALCASGGGITGIYFEMGALKCLNDCLPPGALNSFDQYYGISAGAVIAGIIASGFSIDEFMGSIAGIESDRVPPMSLSLLRLSHLNPSSLSIPVENLLRGIGASLRDVLGGSPKISIESLFLEYNDLLTAPFRADGFEEVLRDLFVRHGASNDFRKLKRPLFIGATDQDAREHVLFGEAPYDDVPVSRAIQASISINPAFSSTKIGDRYYTDGAVTRTSDFVEAIKKGSDLIFALDPLVPYVSKGAAGFAQRRGVLYNVDQDLRTVSYTRFETTRYWVLRQHPEVSLYTFLPANRLRRILSVNPMDHRPYLQIWKGAYLSTLQRIQLLRHKMAGDLAVHGLSLRTDRAETVARRLEKATNPKLADFFSEGKVVIEPPPPLAEPSPPRPPVPASDADVILPALSIDAA